MVNASYVAANCNTKLGALNETLQYLVAALDQLGKVDDALGTLINNSDSLDTTGSTAAARLKRQVVVVSTVVVVTTVQVITVVTRYQTIITSRGKFANIQYMAILLHIRIYKFSHTLIRYSIVGSESAISTFLVKSSGE